MGINCTEGKFNRIYVGKDTWKKLYNLAGRGGRIACLEKNVTLSRPGLLPVCPVISESEISVFYCLSYLTH